MQATYNGWKNYETWDIALWINNDEGLYRIACDFMIHYKGRSPYRDFVKYLDSERRATPDGVAWLDSSLDYRALNRMMRDLVAN